MLLNNVLEECVHGFDGESEFIPARKPRRHINQPGKKEHRASVLSFLQVPKIKTRTLVLSKQFSLPSLTLQSFAEFSSFGHHLVNNALRM